MNNHLRSEIEKGKTAVLVDKRPTENVSLSVWKDAEGNYHSLISYPDRANDPTKKLDIVTRSSLDAILWDLSDEARMGKRWWHGNRKGLPLPYTDVIVQHRVW